jgi:lipopolysaccharide biosynthesis glycosyltransferase
MVRARPSRDPQPLAKKHAVALVSDDNQFPIAAFLASQLARLNPRDDTDIVIVSDAEKELARASEFGVPARLVSLGSWLDGHRFPAGGHSTRAAYYRLFLPELLGSDYDRILYLDLDTHVHKASVFGLLDLDMKNHAIAAVRDTMVTLTALPINANELRETLTNTSRKYLNSGVELIDCDRFVSQQIREKVIAAISGGQIHLHYVDQSALNFVLDGDWLELSPSFNMVVPLWNSFVREVCEPVVSHFAGPNKPWHGPAFIEDHPVKSELERYLAGTPWRDFRARFFNMNAAIVQAAPRLSLGPGLQKPARPAVRSIMTRAKFDMKSFVEYLTATPFADVATGITTPNFDRIPPALRAI